MPDDGEDESDTLARAQCREEREEEAKAEDERRERRSASARPAVLKPGIYWLWGPLVRGTRPERHARSITLTVPTPARITAGMDWLGAELEHEGHTVDVTVSEHDLVGFGA